MVQLFNNNEPKIGEGSYRIIAAPIPFMYTYVHNKIRLNQANIIPCEKFIIVCMSLASVKTVIILECHVLSK